MSTALTPTTPLPVAREGLDCCLSLSTDSPAPFLCESENVHSSSEHRGRGEGDPVAATGALRSVAGRLCRSSAKAAGKVGLSFLGVRSSHPCLRENLAPQRLYHPCWGLIKTRTFLSGNAHLAVPPTHTHRVFYVQEVGNVLQLPSLLLATDLRSSHLQNTSTNATVTSGSAPNW